MSVKLRAIPFCALSFLLCPPAVLSQASASPPSQASFPKEAYVFELLHTRVHFEADGKGSRELTARVRIQSESATHEFGLLRLSYASSFESLDIDYVRVRKPDATLLSTPATTAPTFNSQL